MATTVEKFRKNLQLQGDLIMGLPEEIQGQISDGHPMILVAIEIIPGGTGEPVKLPREIVREAWESSLV